MSCGFPAGTICLSCLAREVLYTACSANSDSYRHGKVMYLKDFENKNLGHRLLVQLVELTKQVSIGVSIDEESILRSEVPQGCQPC